MPLTFADPVVLPAADPDDGRRTAAALAPYLEPSDRVIVVYVVEKAGGAPDKASVEQLEGYAEDIFANARRPLEDAGLDVETEISYSSDVVEGIFDVAVDRGAGAVAFIPREGNRLLELLTGDVARRLVNEASVPVVALPRDATADGS